MHLALILALQSAVPDPLLPIDFDLARLAHAPADLRATSRCSGATTDPESILVCGVRRGGGAFPMAEMARRYAEHPLIAETRLFGNVIGSANLTAVPMDRGAVSNRAAITLRVPF